VIVLDTNVISEALSRSPSPAVMDWLHQQDPSSLCLTAVTVTELAYGIALLPDGARRTDLSSAWERLQESWADRVLSIGADEAEVAGALLAARRRVGRPMTLADALIAGVGVTHGFVLATRNVRYFADTPVSLVNPWDSQTV
jgi:predicted nucleic acid-binding protein